MPVLHLLVGPNGAGKTTFYERVLGPATGLPFINADRIAASLWPGREMERAYAAAARADADRAKSIASRGSFISESVFSHPSKLDLIRRAREAGFRVTLHVVMVPVELAVARVRLRREQGGHAVPEAKVRSRYRRLWRLVEKAVSIADEAVVYDNSRAGKAFRVVSRHRDGILLGRVQAPRWCPLRFPLTGSPATWGRGRRGGRRRRG